MVFRRRIPVGAWSIRAIFDGYSWIFVYLMPEFGGYRQIIWHGTVIKK